MRGSYVDLLLDISSLSMLLPTCFIDRLGLFLKASMKIFLSIEDVATTALL